MHTHLCPSTRGRSPSRHPFLVCCLSFRYSSLINTGRVASAHNSYRRHALDTGTEFAEFPLKQVRQYKRDKLFNRPFSCSRDQSVVVEQTMAVFNRPIGCSTTHKYCCSTDQSVIQQTNKLFNKPIGCSTDQCDVRQINRLFNRPVGCCPTTQMG